MTVPVRHVSFAFIELLVPVPGVLKVIFNAHGHNRHVPCPPGGLLAVLIKAITTHPAAAETTGDGLVSFMGKASLAGVRNKTQDVIPPPPTPPPSDPA